MAMNLGIINGKKFARRGGGSLIKRGICFLNSGESTEVCRYAGKSCFAEEKWKMERISPEEDFVKRTRLQSWLALSRSESKRFGSALTN